MALRGMSRLMVGAIVIRDVGRVLCDGMQAAIEQMARFENELHQTLAYATQSRLA
jgi:hypothetical protein